MSRWTLRYEGERSIEIAQEPLEDDEKENSRIDGPTTRQVKVSDPDDKVKRVLYRRGYKLDERLAPCEYGYIYKAIALNRNHELVAIKMWDMTAMKEEDHRHFLKQELAALLEIRHPNVVQVYDMFRIARRMFVCMEFGDGGDLWDYVHKQGFLQENLARFWFRQVVDALAYIHTEHRIAHRDVKLNNIIITENTWQAKLTDFGFATAPLDSSLSIEALYRVKLDRFFIGTTAYMSPQLIANEPYNPLSVDVWAMGVALFRMRTGHKPFECSSNDPSRRELSRMMRQQWSHPEHLLGRFVAYMSREECRLLVDMLNPNEEARPTMVQVRDHAWTTSRPAGEARP